MAGIGSSFVEAVHLGRDAIGVEYEPPWADLARANLELTPVAKARAGMARSSAATPGMPTVVGPSVHGLVALVLTSPPYGPSLHGQVRPGRAKGSRKSHDRYSTDPANLAHVGLDGLLDAMRTVLTGCARLLRPGGFVAMTVRPWWRDGQLVDLPGAMVSVGEEAGLVLYERNVALLAGLRGDQLVPRSLVLRPRTGPQGSSRRPAPPVIAHEDLLVLRARLSPVPERAPAGT